MSNEEISNEKFLKLAMLEKNLGPEMGKHGEALLRRTGKEARKEGKKRRKEQYRKWDDYLILCSKK